MRVAKTMSTNTFLQGGWQTRCEPLAGEVKISIEQGEGPAFLRQIDRGVVRGVAHQFGNSACHVACRLRVVAQIEHHQSVTEPGIAQANAALAARLFLLLWQWPDRHVQYLF